MVKVHEAIKEVKKPNFKCNFVCALSICWPDQFNVTVSGSVDGMFTWPPKGQNGFGYDPIFTPIGYNKTYGELRPEFKHSISHR